MKVLLTLLVITSLVTGCSVIKVQNMCDKEQRSTVAVLPFKNDDFSCNRNVEDELKGLCYNVVDGTTLLNEYAHSVGKSYENISIDEFSKYAKTQNVDGIVFGSIEVMWFEGHRPTGKIIQSNSSGNYGSGDTANGTKDMAYESYLSVTGNYATATCYMIETATGEQNKIYNHYKIKKVALGNPTSRTATNQ
jgi:hypothetical protein